MQGLFGAGSNGMIFGLLLPLQERPANVTRVAHYPKQIITIITSMVLQVAMAVADNYFGRVVRGETADLRIVCVLASFAA